MKKEIKRKINKAITNFALFWVCVGFMTFIPSVLCCVTEMFWYNSNAGWLGEELLCAAVVELLFGLIVLFIRHFYYELKKEIKKKRRERYERKNATVS